MPIAVRKHPDASPPVLSGDGQKAERWDTLVREKPCGLADWFATALCVNGCMMDFDALLLRFFGTDDFATLKPDEVNAGVERLRLQFGLEKDSGRRFALWCLMHMLGVAPQLDDAFKDKDDREAARDFMDAVDGELDAED